MNRGTVAFSSQHHIPATLWKGNYATAHYIRSLIFATTAAAAAAAAASAAEADTDARVARNRPKNQLRIQCCEQFNYF